MGCPALRLELRRHKLALCYYLALKCPQHGEMRGRREACTGRIVSLSSLPRDVFFDELHGPDLHSATVKAYWDDRKAKAAAAHEPAGSGVLLVR
jgi:hypothetical protein